MSFIGKTSVYLVIIYSLGLVTSNIAAGQEAGCAKGRQELADEERQLKEWEDYVRKGGPGSGNMDLNQLRSIVQQGRADYQRRCGSNDQQQESGTAAPDGGAANQRRNAEEDNPWHHAGGDGSDPDNPFAAPSGKSGMRNSPQQGGAGVAGQGEGDPDNPFQGNEDKDKGKTVAKTKEPPRDFDGKPCHYFTKPSIDDSHVNGYAEGSFICYQDRMYECNDHHWVARADCGAYDKNTIRRAEEIEKTRFDTKIYEE